jgi:hypothetical protein
MGLRHPRCGEGDEPNRIQAISMTRYRPHPIPAVLLLLCLLSTPVTYRGGAADPHPHVFVQLWIDAARGEFTHAAHRVHEGHHLHTPSGSLEYQPLSANAIASLIDEHTPTLSAFVVSDYGVTILLTPVITALEIEKPQLVTVTQTQAPEDLRIKPEAPPPRPLSIA